MIARITGNYRGKKVKCSTWQLQGITPDFRLSKQLSTSRLSRREASTSAAFLFSASSGAVACSILGAEGRKFHEVYTATQKDRLFPSRLSELVMTTTLSKGAVREFDDLTKPPFLRRVCIRGYKSIEFCDVHLKPLTVLVGRNASGKSNFLDALAFLRDLMEVGVAEAVRRRGGWSAIHCRSLTDNVIGIDVEVACTGWVTGPTANGSSPTRSRVPLIANYAIEIADQPRQQPQAVVEKLRLRSELDGSEFILDFDHGKFTFNERAGKDSTGPDWIPSSLKLYVTRLEPFILQAIREEPFVGLADGLRWIGCYNFRPEAIRDLHKPNPGWLLERDGSNLASVIETTRENEAWVIDRVRRYLSVITDSVELLGVAKYGDYETVRFRVAGGGLGQPLEFDAASMSDGTLRILAALVAAFQIVLPYGSPSLVGIEEPETSLHPAAMRALVDALDEATLRTQVLLTTHSADMLDNPTVRPENIRVVQLIDGRTVLGPVDEASADIVRRKLNTLGGLERDGLLEPSFDDLDRQERLGRAPEDLPA
jgi:predicted ATPase